MKLNLTTLSLVIAAISLSPAMTSCFTGIESTPKITATDVKKQNIPVRQEDVYLSSVTSQPFSQWKKGKRFHVTDDKFAMLTLPGSNRPTDLKGATIMYNSCEEVTDLSGNKILQITFVTNNNQSLIYRTSQSAASIKKHDYLDIPFLVEMSVVDSVKEKLLGNTYYIITPAWYDTAGQSIHGRKFVPVKVRNVLPGNGYYSAQLQMEDEKGNPFMLYLSAGNDLKSLRQFASLFSLTDPRNNYPQITDETWENIINGRVAPEMTREECRLALGTPSAIDHSVGYSSIREIWTYENGIYLIFEDNILRSFRQ